MSLASEIPWCPPGFHGNAPYYEILSPDFRCLDSHSLSQDYSWLGPTGSVCALTCITAIARRSFLPETLDITVQCVGLSARRCPLSFLFLVFFFTVLWQEGCQRWFYPWARCILSGKVCGQILLILHILIRLFLFVGLFLWVEEVQAIEEERYFGVR